MFGDFTKGFPPTLLTAGTRDLFLSNAARMHNTLRRSGNHGELIIEEAMPKVDSLVRRKTRPISPISGNLRKGRGTAS